MSCPWPHGLRPVRGLRLGESGINKTFREAPQFLGFYPAFIAIGAGVIICPTMPLIKIMFLSQTVNGILLPIVLIIMLRLVNNKEVKGEYVNSKRMNIIDGPRYLL